MTYDLRPGELRRRLRASWLLLALAVAMPSSGDELAREASYRNDSMEVSRVTAIAEFEYREKTFYFCSGAAGRHSRRRRRGTSSIIASME